MDATASASNNVGICAIEVYFPSFCVDQKELEKYNNVSAGKYTIGLGQDQMAFTGDREDINSISLTVVKGLLEKYGIDPMSIGRMEIGTESLIDKSKSTKTVLMELFSESGNTDIEGATVVNACYGGTAALLNALLWADSPSWDGRYAIVVAADIAVYADGPARPSGGCGAVAMLVGRNAPLAINLRTRVTHSTHVWDFFKPRMDSEYPEVNGALSQTCYLRALDDCYARFKARQSSSHDNGSKSFGCTSVDHFLFHSPYNKLVQKSFARIVFADMLDKHLDSTPVCKWANISMDKTYEDKDLEMKLRDVATPLYQSKVAPACDTSKRIGNTYTASVYFNLANLVSNRGADLGNEKVVLFSYGSGALASMFEVIPSNSHNTGAFTLERMQKALNLAARLESREVLSPKSLDIALKARENSHDLLPFQPTFQVERLFPGTYYLDQIKNNFERVYLRRPINAIRITGAELEEIMVQQHPSIDTEPSVSSPTSLNRSRTEVWATGRHQVHVVVTGVAAGVPGREGDVFAPGVDNIRRIIAGESFITEIPASVKDTMLEKNVFHLSKDKDGEVTKKKVASFAENINVCASIGNFDLTSYGVPESIANTMDKAVQVAVAAGLEALKDAGIVSGNKGEGMAGWILPKAMQNSTGIVYATSFPALDAAIGEVSKYFASKSVEKGHIPEILNALKSRLAAQKGGELSADCLEALKHLGEEVAGVVNGDTPPGYEFDRKFLFRLLVLGNAQLAQIIKARGPNMQTNAACAGATQAVALAFDMIQVGRAERMVVIAGDNAASDVLMPWLGNGFRALGAACLESDVNLAALPFDKRRSGMILGSGGIGIVLESEEGARRRHALAEATGTASSRAPFRCRLLGTLISNSAFHGAAMDRDHIADEMERFLSAVEKEQGISRRDIAKEGVYFSHETCTHASPTASCSYNEVNEN